MTPHMQRLALGLSFGTLAACLLYAEPAAAAEPVKGEVLVVLGKEAAGSVDAELGQVKALQQPPFNGFKSMKVLSKSPVTLEIGQASTVELPNGRRLQLKLEERMPDGRFKVTVSINQPDKQDYLPLLSMKVSPGEHFFVAGQKHEGGTLIIGVKVGERPAQKAP
jgi:hypothetical protein